MSKDQRVAPDRSKRTFEAALDGLPDGVLVAVPVWGEEAYLVRVMTCWPGRPEDTVNDDGDRRARRFGC
jgi:hypothetical protein